MPWGPRVAPFCVSTAGAWGSRCADPWPWGVGDHWYDGPSLSQGTTGPDPTLPLGAFGLCITERGGGGQNGNGAVPNKDHRHPFCCWERV